MRTYIQITGVVSGVIALLHVARLILDWPAQVAGWVVPIWISWLAILVAGALCVWAFRLVRSELNGSMQNSAKEN